MHLGPGWSPFHRTSPSYPILSWGYLGNVRVLLASKWKPGMLINSLHTEDNPHSTE